MPEIKDNDKAQNSDITKSPSESLKSSPTKKDVDVTTEALNHFAQGKRHLLVNDITAAVNSLQEACRLLGGHYGEIAPECADAYFYYGKALLELARIETGVLGNALDGVPEGEDQNNSQVEDPAKMTENENGSDQEEEGEDDNEDPEDGANEVEPEGEQVEDSDEEIENIHLAWEMLELSKVIYEKQLKEKEDSTLSLKLADVFLKLGELSVERELYNESIQDFNRCLEILTKELKPDDRQLAEIHYQIAVAYSMMHEYKKSIESYETSVKIIEQRMANLAKVIEDKNTWSEERKLAEAAKQKDPFNSEQNEIDELAKLLPDLQEKISDMRELKHDTDMKIDKLKESPFVKMLTGTSNGSGASTSNDSPFSNSVSSVDDSKPVSDIGHLIKKKRKPEEPATVIQVKRAKSENEAEKEPSQEKNNADKATKAPELEDKNEESNIENGKSVDASS